MALSKGVSAVYLLPGMKAKISMPRVWKAVGERKKLKANGEFESVALTKGFMLENEEVGDLEGVDGEVAVIYTHKKFAQNKITFFARTGEIGEVHVISVPIHDHSSIVTGGPAYGTYFTDDETEGTDDGGTT
mgnify:CR=1 FL=1